jgi:hypothetical protein
VDLWSDPDTAKPFQLSHMDMPEVSRKETETEIFRAQVLILRG